MSASHSFIEHLKECLGEMGPITVRRMFGGAGVYADGVMFALVAGDALYFKTDETTRGAFDAEGLGPFVFASKGKDMRTSYWRAPDRLFDDPSEMVTWGRTALDAARRSKLAKPKRPSTRRRKIAGA